MKTQIQLTTGKLDSNLYIHCTNFK